MLHNTTTLRIREGETTKPSSSSSQKNEEMGGRYYYHALLLYLEVIVVALLPAMMRATMTNETGSSSSCYTDWCTSPDGHGGYDCWAGSSAEPCTCMEGKAKETGKSLEHEGRTYYGYACCKDDGTNNGTLTGEHCGDFKGGDSKKEYNEVVGGIVTLIFAIGFGIGIWFCCRRCGCCRCQPKSEHHSGESTSHTQQPMWSPNVELERTKNDALVPDKYKTPDNYYR